MPGTVVCLPTYDERENVEPMVRALGAVLDLARDRVLVIDDASPDGTGDIARGLAAQLPWVSVLQRVRKDGMGPAYAAGLRVALEHGADRVVTMDCDFSHDPSDVPRLVDAAADADLVVGSRYVDGGSAEGSSALRRLVSRCGCTYAQAVLGGGVRDLTSGFKCFRRAALEQIDFESAYVYGYAFHVELTYRALRAGLRVAEVPIAFGVRRAGVSKLSTSILAEAVWKVPGLRVRALAGRL